MPFLALSVILLMGAAGIVTDLMRDFQTVRELRYAAQATALYAASYSAAATGAYNQSAVQNAITTPGTALTNSAQIGPTQVYKQGAAPVVFEATDAAFVSNPADAGETFLKLTARRQGPTSVAQFFLPLLFTGLNTALPKSIRTFDTTQSIEVIGQPATRIGAGPPSAQSGVSRSDDFYGYAALPIAISYQQFASAVGAAQGAASVTRTIDFVSSANAAVLPGHIPAAFVNLAATAGNVNYHDTAQGALAVGQLQGLLSYFALAGQSAALAPACIETGSPISAFDPADPAFTSGQNQTKIAALVNALPDRTYILPVVAGSQPLLATAQAVNVRNTVVGFAYARITKPSVSAQPFSVNITFVPSPPLRNVASAAGLATLPPNAGNFLPAPALVFQPRTFDAASGGVTSRYPGVAMAPALSPRPN
ncbi:MAG: hypothetical protein JSS86_11155 [Cyanobacteria bacterium SZAS LIN-2]|nr:hypothetical protein [Cyanobacteria bacterium SZAS LIN-2]MBS2007288.1 hypothetical protein [Cyanobacteria bacterium SZAS TMP-1]